MDPNPIPLGSTVTLTLSGGQGSTYVLDQFSNDIIGNCSWTANNPDACNPKNPLYHPSGTGCGFWNTLTCKALKPGTATWTHYWRNCAPNNCNITSRQCEKYITISVLAGPTPLPPAGPCLGNICPTQIGPFDVSNPQAIIKTILIIVLGIAGFAAVILIVYSGYIFMSSGGDKQKIAAAREILTASLLGLLFIIFSVLILEVIGIHILQIPGLG